jgi:putative Mg2+ transporter-C (MgtC) family protein
MPLSIDWRVVLLRLFLALVAGGAVGFNRGEQGHPAGLRTTILVCLAAAASMIQVNLLLELSAQKQSLVELDLMRLPLGILSGMGFIGGGAILKRGDIVHGVTTAATLWFVTVMGLCLGGGQIMLGFELLGAALFVLWVLKWIERRYVEDRRATLQLTLSKEGLSEGALLGRLEKARFEVARCASAYDRTTDGSRSFEIDVRWRAHDGGKQTPASIAELMDIAGVVRLKWDPKT